MDDEQCDETDLGYSILIGAHSSDDTQSPRVNLGSTVANDTNDDLLPALFTPCLTAVAFAQMRNILDDTVHGAAEEILFLVVHSHHNEQLCASRRVVMHLA